MLKNCFRRFKAPLNQKGDLDNGWRSDRKRKTASSQAASIIRARLFLHNIFIDLYDDVPIENVHDPEELENENLGPRPLAGAIDGEEVKIRSDIMKVYLQSIKN